MRVFFTASAVFLLTSLAVLPPSTSASAAAFDCRGLYLSVATALTTQSTTSTTLANIPGVSVTVPVDGCVRVQFSAQVMAPSPGGVRVRLVLDGNSAGTPVSADFRTGGTGFDNRVVTFVIRNAGSQARTLRIQYSSIDGRRVRLAKSVMTVWYTEPPV